VLGINVDFCRHVESGDGRILRCSEICYLYLAYAYFIAFFMP
jgi:hypothetical protein